MAVDATAEAGEGAMAGAATAAAAAGLAQAVPPCCARGLKTSRPGRQAARAAAGVPIPSLRARAPRALGAAAGPGQPFIPIRWAGQLFRARAAAPRRVEAQAAFPETSRCRRDAGAAEVSRPPTSSNTSAIDWHECPRRARKRFTSCHVAAPRKGSAHGASYLASSGQGHQRSTSISCDATGGANGIKVRGRQGGAATGARERLM